MSRLSPQEKLEKLQKEKAETLAKIRSVAGRVAAQNRKADTRRKILLGTILLELSAANPKFLAWVENRIAKLPEKDAAPFQGWNFADAAAAAATRAKEREEAAKEEAKKATKAAAAPSSPAPAQAGAFGGVPASPRPNTAPAPTGAPSAQPGRVPPARS